jgi:hypothetical protein
VLLRAGQYRRFLRLTMPLAVLLLGLAFYNYKTLNAFAVSPVGGLALAGATMTFADTSAEYSDCESRAMEHLLETVTPGSKQTVQSSFNMKELHPLFFFNHYHVLTFYKDLVKECGYSSFIEALPAVKKVAVNAIKKCPDCYAKFVLTSFYNYVITGNLEEHQLFYYSEPKRRYENIYIKKKPTGNLLFSTYVPDLIPVELKKYTYKEFYDATDPVGFQARNDALMNSLSFKLFDLYTLKFNRIFLRGWFWPVLLILLFIFSGIKLLKSGLRDLDALLIFSVCCLNFCSAAVVSLVEPSFYHYTYMTEFTYYLAAALSPLLVRKYITF